MKEEDPEVTRLLSELQVIVNRHAGPGVGLEETRRDVGMSSTATWTPRRLRDIHRLTRWSRTTVLLFPLAGTHPGRM